MGVGGERLLAWYAAGDTEYRLPGTDMVFRVSPKTAEFLRETRETTGALVFGRRTFDLTHGWGGNHPLDVPVFVVSSSVPPEWVYEGSPFTFVTDGLQSALEQAQAVAGDKDVGVGAASIVQQCIERDSSMRSTSTWSPSCSGAASVCSTTSAPGRSTWSARG